MLKLENMEYTFKSELRNINKIITKHETVINDHDFKINHVAVVKRFPQLIRSHARVARVSLHIGKTYLKFLINIVIDTFHGCFSDVIPVLYIPVFVIAYSKNKGIMKQMRR